MERLNIDIETYMGRGEWFNRGLWYNYDSVCESV